MHLTISVPPLAVLYYMGWVQTESICRNNIFKLSNLSMNWRNIMLIHVGLPVSVRGLLYIILYNIGLQNIIGYYRLTK